MTLIESFQSIKVIHIHDVKNGVDCSMLSYMPWFHDKKYILTVSSFAFKMTYHQPYPYHHPMISIINSHLFKEETVMNILLVCSAGMSTSLLVTRMQENAQSQNIGIHIEARPIGEVEAYGQDADVILLGPQVRFQLSHVQKSFPQKPIEVINMRDYGMMDGKKVLSRALELYTQHQ